MSCPVCGKKPGQEKYKPFCSSRCATLDLGRWLSGSYAIPAVEDDELPDDLPEADPSYRTDKQ